MQWQSAVYGISKMDSQTQQEACCSQVDTVRGLMLAYIPVDEIPRLSRLARILWLSLRVQSSFAETSLITKSSKTLEIYCCTFHQNTL